MTLSDVMKVSRMIGVDMSRLSVVEYILTNADYDTNTFSGSYSEIAKETDTSCATVARVMQALQKKKILTPVKDGVWQITEKMVYRKEENAPGTDEEPIWFTAPVSK